METGNRMLMLKMNQMTAAKSGCHDGMGPSIFSHVSSSNDS